MCMYEHTLLDRGVLHKDIYYYTQINEALSGYKFQLQYKALNDIHTNYTSIHTYYSQSHSLYEVRFSYWYITTGRFIGLAERPVSTNIPLLFNFLLMVLYCVR